MKSGCEGSVKFIATHNWAMSRQPCFLRYLAKLGFSLKIKAHMKIFLQAYV